MGERGRIRPLWLGLLASTSVVFLLAVLSPLFSPEVQVAVRRAFAPVCHQIPSRSPHLAGLPTAICDRCTGIYFGVVLGVGVMGWERSLSRAFALHGPSLLVGALIPMGVDWIGPILGLWSNGPYSRALTGLVFGAVAASFVTYSLLRKVGRAGQPTGSGSS